MASSHVSVTGDTLHPKSFPGKVTCKNVPGDLTKCHRGLTVVSVSSSNGHETYAEWFSRQLDERAYTTRSFARAWNPEDPETARRMVRRYLKGVVPIERTRREIARVLGSEKNGPDEPEDD